MHYPSWPNAALSGRWLTESQETYCPLPAIRLNASLDLCAEGWQENAKTKESFNHPKRLDCLALDNYDRASFDIEKHCSCLLRPDIRPQLLLEGFYYFLPGGNAAIVVANRIVRTSNAGVHKKPDAHTAKCGAYEESRGELFHRANAVLSGHWPTRCQ